MIASNPWTSWSYPPLVIVGAALSCAFFIQGWLRLRGRGRPDLAPWSRVGLFAGGIAVVTFAIVSPVDAVGEGYLQAAHMLQHVLIADLGVALLVLAVRGPLAVFLLPRDLLVPAARQQWLRATLRWLLRPGITVALWLALLVAWHIPVLYEAALRIRAVHDLQHFSFVFVGVLLWVQLIDPLRHRRLTVSERIGLAALVFAAGQILAYVMVFSYRPFYGVYAEQQDRLLGLSPLTDHKLAGVVMMVEQALTIGVFILWQLRLRANASSSASLGRANGSALPWTGNTPKGMGEMGDE